MFDKNQDYWADISINDEFIIIETQSGLGRVGVDPDFPQFILDFNADFVFSDMKDNSGKYYDDGDLDPSMRSKLKMRWNIGAGVDDV